MSNLRLTIFALALVGLLAFGCINFGGEQTQPPPGSGNQEPPPAQATYPSLQIIGPGDGEIIKTNDSSISVKVVVETSDILLKTPALSNVAGEGHLYFTLDGTSGIATEQKEYTFSNVGLGVHTIKVEIRQNDNTPYTPKVMKVITFTVQKDTETVPPGKYEVLIENYAYFPADITVRVGDTITWKNNDVAPHTATSIGSFNTGAIPPGGAVDVKFDREGTFDYVCTLHPNMSGKVIVTK